MARPDRFPFVQGQPRRKDSKWSWWHRRKERQQQVIWDADNLVALFADGAYSEAVARARHEHHVGGDSGHWLAVRREIARRVGKVIGLDTATRYVDG